MNSTRTIEDNSKRVLWLGAGALAQAFSQLPAAKAWTEIVGVRRNCAGLATGLTPLEADFCEPASLAGLQQCPSDAVVVTLTPGGRSDEQYRAGYVTASHNLVDAIASWPSPPKRVLFVSSTSVYGQNDGQSVDESSITAPTGFSGVRLLEAEQVWRDAGWPLAVVRFSGIYGPGRYRLLQQLQSGQTKQPERPAYTNRIHQTDCARVIAHLLGEAFIEGEFIATDDHSVLDTDVKQWLAKALNTGYEGGSLNAATVAGKRLSNNKLRATGFEFRFPSFREGYPAIIDTYLK